MAMNIKYAANRFSRLTVILGLLASVIGGAVGMYIEFGAREFLVSSSPPAS